MFAILFISLLSYVLARISFTLIPDLLIEADSIATNYSGEKIPLGYGIIFTLNLSLILVTGALLNYYSTVQVYYLLSLILPMAFVGILDDTLGDKKYQGFKGHFKSLLLNYKLTTGAIKAILGSYIIFFINFYWNQNWFDIILNTLLILFMSNFINLLDLRPGRALKVSLLILLSILFFSSESYLLVIAIIITIVYALDFDLKGKGMMGDVGANVLGVLVGGLLVQNLQLEQKVLVIVLLLVIHIYSEFNSLSLLIKQNKILKYIDKLGR